MKYFKKQSLILLFLFSVLIFSFSAIPVSAASSPARVQKLKQGVATQNSINISWQGQSGISGYQVYRATAYDGKYKRLINIHPNMHAFCNKNLQSGQEYYYKVRAFFGSGSNISYGKFSKILTAHTKASSPGGAFTRTRSNIRAHAGTSYSVLATVNANTSVSVICTTKDKSGQSWSHIQYSVNGRTLTGYIRSDLLQKNSSPTYPTGTVTAAFLNVRSLPGTNNSIVGTLSRGQKVSILGSKKSASGVPWYYISFVKNGRTLTGYASAYYIKK